MQLKRTLGIVTLVMICSLLLLSSLAGSVNAQGEEGDSQEISVPDQSKSFAWMIVQLIFYTLLVIVLIILFARFIAKRQQKWGDHQLFQNLGGTSLGANKSLQLIKMGGKVYLLGVGDEIRLLDVIDDPEEIERLLSDQAGDNQWLAPAMGAQLTSLISRLGWQRKQVDFKSLLDESLTKQRTQRDHYEQQLPDRKRLQERSKDNLKD